MHGYRDHSIPRVKSICILAWCSVDTTPFFIGHRAMQRWFAYRNEIGDKKATWLFFDWLFIREKHPDFARSGCFVILRVS